MPPIASAFVRRLSALLLLLGCTWVVELGAFLLLWRSQTLAPYAFFPHQAWDFVAKVRWFGDSGLAWAPSLPDRFAGAEAGDQLSALAPLLPATLATAVTVGALAALLASLVFRRSSSLRRHVLGWAALALLVHAAASLPSFALEDGLRLSRLAFRARSLVVDGMLLASALSLLACGLACAVAPLLERSRPAALAGLIALGAAATWGATADVPTTPQPPAQAAAADPSRPLRNVLLISLDSLRADHVGAYGYGRDTSPNFDRFAKEGVLFRNAIATSSWTLPTHLTMFTGRSQLSHGVVVDTRVLPESIPTLGEIFHEAGYATAGFVSGPYCGPQYGYGRGMDTYLDLSAEFGGKGAEARGAILSPKINEMGLDWLERLDGKQPFFLFLHYFDIHYDYVPPAPYDAMFDPDYTGTMDGTKFIERHDVHAGMDPRDLEHIVALYDGEIRFTDFHVGKVLDRLREKGLLDSTVVLILSDHGEEFFEHGNKGHHRTVYEEAVRVPFALRLPGGVHARKEIPAQVSTMDVFPTLLDAAGFTLPSDLEGESLAAWLGGKESTREAVFSDFYDKKGFNLQVARRTPERKTIQHFNRITHPKKGPFEEYDLAADPVEKRNLARSGLSPSGVDSVAVMTRWLDEQWRAYRAFEAAAGGRGSVEIDEETRQKLKSLGYVGD
jgi:arylsulfatase A-like enzyme